jgi:hypothetical protein
MKLASTRGHAEAAAAVLAADGGGGAPAPPVPPRDYARRPAAATPQTSTLPSPSSSSSSAHDRNGDDADGERAAATARPQRPHTAAEAYGTFHARLRRWRLPLRLVLVGGVPVVLTLPLALLAPAETGADGVAEPLGPRCTLTAAAFDWFIHGVLCASLLFVAVLKRLSDVQTRQRRSGAVWVYDVAPPLLALLALHWANTWLADTLHTLATDTIGRCTGVTSVTTGDGGGGGVDIGVHFRERETCVAAAAAVAQQGAGGQHGVWVPAPSAPCVWYGVLYLLDVLALWAPPLMAGRALLLEPHGGCAAGDYGTEAAGGRAGRTALGLLPCLGTRGLRAGWQLAGMLLWGALVKAVWVPVILGAVQPLRQLTGALVLWGGGGGGGGGEAGGPGGGDPRVSARLGLLLALLVVPTLPNAAMLWMYDARLLRKRQSRALRRNRTLLDIFAGSYTFGSSHGDGDGGGGGDPSMSRSMACTLAESRRPGRGLRGADLGAALGRL